LNNVVDIPGFHLSSSFQEIRVDFKLWGEVNKFILIVQVNDQQVLLNKLWNDVTGVATVQPTLTLDTFPVCRSSRTFWAICCDGSWSNWTTSKSTRSLGDSFVRNDMRLIIEYVYCFSFCASSKRPRYWFSLSVFSLMSRGRKITPTLPIVTMVCNKEWYSILATPMERRQSIGHQKK